MATNEPGRFAHAAWASGRVCNGWNAPGNAPNFSTIASAAAGNAPLQWTTPCPGRQDTARATVAIALSGVVMKTRSQVSATFCALAA